jgi:acyl-CoA synthetase (AMP-forming)/AMP-acid ligase II
MFSIKLDESLKDKWKLPLVADYIKKWSDVTPDNIALMSADSGVSFTYREFDEMITLYALRLKEMGIKKGDVIGVQWLSTPEFFMLTYACATVGAIISPLDIRLQVSEIVRDMNKISPAAFFCMGKTPLRDFTEVSSAVAVEVKSLKHIIQHTPGALDEAVAGGVAKFSDLFAKEKLAPLAENSSLTSALLKEYKALNKRDPHIIIFTTGTTGFPKPALICNENTITNNAVFSREVGLWGTACRYLNSMPTSHVAGTCQGPMTVWLTGGTVITVNVYQPELILKYIQKYRPTWWGGVPTMFHMMWQMPHIRIMI